MLVRDQLARQGIEHQHAECVRLATRGGWRSVPESNRAPQICSLADHRSRNGPRPSRTPDIPTEWWRRKAILATPPIAIYGIASGTPRCRLWPIGIPKLSKHHERVGSMMATDDVRNGDFSALSWQASDSARRSVRVEHIQSFDVNRSGLWIKVRVGSTEGRARHVLVQIRPFILVWSISRWWKRFGPDVPPSGSRG